MLILERKRFNEIELERAAGRKKDYEVFMALANHIGHDKRGNTTFVRDEDGNEIVVSKEGRVRDVHQGTPVYRTVEVKEKVKDDNTQQIAEAFPEMADGAVTATAARPLSRTRSLTPQCVTLPLSEIAAGDRRLDAEVYLSDGFTVRRAIRDSLLAVSPLGQLARIWQPSRLKGIRVDREHGAPFLAATQAFDIWPTPRKWLAPSKTPSIADRYVSPGWILVTCSGTVGTVILTYSAHADKVISHDLLRVEIEEPSLRSYVYTFLRTRFGRTMMRGSHYGNVIKHLEVSHLEQIPVPVLPRLRDEIHNRIGSVFTARNEAYRLDMTARLRFAEAMSDQPEAPPEGGYAVQASRLFHGRRRLEAFAHSPAAQLVARTYERNAESVARLGQIARAFVPGRFKRIYGEQGTTYLDSGPVFKVNPELSKFLTPATPIDFDAYMVKRGWLLMACSGQIYGINGQAILADRWHEGKVITQHIMRIVPEDSIRPGYLQTVLSHPTLGKPLVVSQAYGTSVPELAVEDIEGLPIPRLAVKQEEEIADAAERASELRMKANDAENDAVAKLEGELVYELAGRGRSGPLGGRVDRRQSRRDHGFVVQGMA